MSVMTTAKHVNVALEHVSAAIIEASQYVRNEARYPDGNADDSDARLRDGRQIVTRLREIRRELEDLTFAEYLL